MPSPRRPPPKRWWNFYKSATGAPVFLDELHDLGLEVTAAVTDTLNAISKGKALPREDEKVDADLRAVHVTFGGCEYRVLYGVRGATGRVLLAVHVFNKKTRKLPASALKTAKRRLRDWDDRGKRSKQT